MTGSSTGNPDRAVEAAGPQVPLARRFLALMIDWILCLMVGGFFGRPVQTPWAAPLVLLLLYTIFLGIFGQTPGMWLTRIRCASVRTGGTIGLPRAFVRAILLIAVLPVLVMDGAQRGLHDRLVDSMIVPVRR